ncbi:hypothetical protein [Nonomuraea dietziae]|uniref:hypothetical protein n=1 Tax=Nonomuraea dietziae TaxID=65515 RepID=UPI003412B226
MRQQPHLQRARQDRPLLAGPAQPVEGLGRRAAVAALARPAEQLDRGVEPCSGSQPKGSKRGSRPPISCMPYGEPVRTSMTEGGGASAPSIMASAFA